MPRSNVSGRSINDHADRVTRQREVARQEHASALLYPMHFGLHSCLLRPPDMRFECDAFQV
jgi:hypothetical protein